MADSDGGNGAAPNSVKRIGYLTKEPAKIDDDRRRRFARELNRAMFGRNYWDDRLEAEKQRASRKSK